MPCDFANSSAPSATSKTCGVFSITSRARWMGLAMCFSAATEPASQRSPVHDGRVHFGHTFLGVISAAAGVVKAGILHHADSGLNGVHAGTAARQDRVASTDGLHHAVAPRFDDLLVRGRTVARAAMRHQHETLWRLRGGGREHEQSPAPKSS